MKKYLLFVLMSVAAATSWGAANELTINQRNATDTAFVLRFLPGPTPGNTALLIYDGATNLPTYASVGAGLSLASGVLSAGTSTVAWADITGKPSLAPVATSGAYADLSGTPSIPSLMQRTRAATDASGALTWTFPTAFATTPTVQVTAQEAGAFYVNHRIVAISPTAVTIQVDRSSAVTILGISVLGLASAAATTVNLLALN